MSEFTKGKLAQGKSNTLLYINGVNFGDVLVGGLPHKECEANATELVRRWNSHDALLGACKKSPAPNFFAEFASFAEECSTKPSMAVYRGQFRGLATFLRSCVDRSEKIGAAIAAAKE